MTSATLDSETSHQLQLLGQTVVVIGGSSGIGLEAARQARAQGADVVFTARGPDRLRHAADRVDGQFGPETSLDAVGAPNLDVLHPLTGPVCIDGAEHGDLLDIEILDIESDRYGYTVQVPGFGFLRDVFPEPLKVNWDIADGWATSSDLPGVRIPGAPFMGTIGLSPGHELLAAITAREQDLLDRGGFVLPPSAASAVPSDPHIAAHALRTIPPREQAGNIDIKQLSKGAHLLLPVDVPRALFSAGDAHLAQGDCETCGTAIEMNATLHVRFTVRRGEAPQKGIRFPQFVSLAARNALLDMIDHLGHRGWTPHQAYAICSVAVSTSRSARSSTSPTCSCPPSCPRTSSPVGERAALPGAASNKRKGVQSWI